MRILATQYTLTTKSLDIYVAGCKGDRNGRHCPGCHNPESWDFDQGRPYDLVSATEIWPHFIEFGQLIQNAMIFGGEPLDQDESDLIKMLIDISGFGVQIWLFTRHELNEVPASVKEFCDFIKCGSYDPALLTDDNIQCGIKLASSNQRIYLKGIDY